MRWRDPPAGIPPIPHGGREKPPPPRLLPRPTDKASLPPSQGHDPHAEAYVEDDRSPEEIAAGGFEPALVDRVIELIDRAEYKRRQAAPGIKITPKAFGRDRRMPITNRYRRR